MKPDPKRARDAVEKAYDDNISVLFRTLIENLIEARAAGATISENDALAMFARGMKIAGDAYDKAMAAIGP